MSRAVYPAIIERGETGFGVYFPDLAGCTSAGDTFTEAIVNAREALAMHIAGLAEDGIELPKPSTIGALPAPPADVVVEAIILDGATVPSGQATQFSIALDDALLQEIDALAPDRSRFLANAARAELARRAAAG